MDQNVHLYEGLFLMSQTGGSDLAGALAHVSDLLARIEAEIVLLQKWDDRRLAYPVRGQKRGLYLLAYFKAQAGRIINLERDCNLSENVARAMILRADHIGEVELEIERKGAASRAEARDDDGPGDDSDAFVDAEVDSDERADAPARAGADD